MPEPRPTGQGRERDQGPAAGRTSRGAGCFRLGVETHREVVPWTEGPGAVGWRPAVSSWPREPDGGALPSVPASS